MTEPQQKPGRSKQDYGTPREFLAAVRGRLRIVDFDRDLAASFDNRVTDRFFDVDDEGLAQPWNDGLIGNGWNWLNPPYGKIGPWVQKAHIEAQTTGAQTAILIPVATGSGWWRAWVHGKARILLLSPRITFIGAPLDAKGKPQPFPKDCALLLYGPYETPCYDTWVWRAAGRATRPLAAAA